MKTIINEKYKIRGEEIEIRTLMMKLQLIRH